MCAFVLSRMARWACRSLARFLANWSGVRFATPRAEVQFNLRLRPAPVAGGPLLSGAGVSASAEVNADGVGESSSLTTAGPAVAAGVTVGGPCTIEEEEKEEVDDDDSRAAGGATSFRGGRRVAMAWLAGYGDEAAIQHRGEVRLKQKEQGIWLNGRKMAVASGRAIRRI